MTRAIHYIKLIIHFRRRMIANIWGFFEVHLLTGLVRSLFVDWFSAKRKASTMQTHHILQCDYRDWIHITRQSAGADWKSEGDAVSYSASERRLILVLRRTVFHSMQGLIEGFGGKQN